MIQTKTDKCYLALDESGKLNPNDVCSYFIVGGFIYSNKELVKAAIRRAELEVKEKFRIPRERELKGNKCDEFAIVEFVNKVFDEIGDELTPIFSVVARKELNDHFTMSEPLAYNFFVNNIIQFNSKLYDFDEYFKNIYILMDDRNLKPKELNDLEVLLKTNFIEHPYDLTTYYLSSKGADVIRFADVLDHVVYHYYNNREGDKNRAYQNGIKKEYLEKMKAGTIYYPFKKSYFKQLRAVEDKEIDKMPDNEAKK